MVLTKCIAHFTRHLKLQNLFYSTTAVHGGFYYTPKFSSDDERKILDVLNQSNAEQLSRFDVSQMRIKSLESRKNKKGPFKSLIEVLEVDGLGVKNLERLCDSIIMGDENVFVQMPVNAKNRRNNFLVPNLPSDIVLKSAVALHLNPTGISWAKLNSVNNQLCTWDYFDISNFPKKMLPNEIFQLAMVVLSKIPNGDLYIFEAPISALGQKSTAIPVTQNIELTSMLLALINTSKKTNGTIKDNEVLIENKVHYLRHKLPARLFRTLIGKEKVSSYSAIHSLLSADTKILPCTAINIEDTIKQYYYSQSTVHKDLLGQALLIAATFMDLCYYKNENSIKVLYDRRK